MNNRSVLPTDLVTLVLEYVPSSTLALLQEHGSYSKLILSSPNIWRHFNLNLHADLNRITHNNPLIHLESITIPNTSWCLYYQSHNGKKSHCSHPGSHRKPFYYHERHILKMYRENESELIYLNMYISMDTMNEIILYWLNKTYGLNHDNKPSVTSLVSLFIPIEFVKKIRILCYLSHINNTLSFLTHYLSDINYQRNCVNKKDVTTVSFCSRLQIDMDCFMHIRPNSAISVPSDHAFSKYSDLNPNPMKHLVTIKSLIVDNCDLTRQFNIQQTTPFNALPNLECLTLCCSYVSFYSSTLTTIHSMLFSSKYQPFYTLWKSFPKLKTIVITEKNSMRLYTDLRNTRQLIPFPQQIQNLWFPHSAWFDLRRIEKLNVLCLEPCDVYINVFNNNLCMMEEIKVNSNLRINHLFINVASVTSMEVDIDIDVPMVNASDDNQNNVGRVDEEEQSFMNGLVGISNILSKANKITFCTVPSEAVVKALQASIPSDKIKNASFTRDITVFQRLIHDEMEEIDVFDNQYEYYIHNKAVRDQHTQICHLDIIDDILGSITQ